MPDGETNEILQRLTRVETKIDLMMTARDIAQEALQSSKAAHHRLDEMKKDMQEDKKQIEDEMRDMKNNQKWLIGTTISVAAFFLTALGFLLKWVNG